MDKTAHALLDAGILTLRFDQPVTFKSGIVSPVYLDNRLLTFHPQAWHTVIESLQALVVPLAERFEIVAGIETAGIPHSAALAYVLGKPSVFVRKQPKEHGMKKRVEGGDVSGRRVLLLEDQISTGGSSLSGVQALRDEGAVVTDCIAITSYGFTEAHAAFDAAGVSLHVLVPFESIVAAAQERAMMTRAQHETVLAWLANPKGWGDGR